MAPRRLRITLDVTSDATLRDLKEPGLWDHVTTDHHVLRIDPVSVEVQRRKSPTPVLVPA